ncbi:RNA dependent RNA polymerase-domain-containing protein [Syncephalis plumigaleata]|nr:RNA dependent RNA polymerase-domain-containing protein [Syncephalis plumigaleata]
MNPLQGIPATVSNNNSNNNNNNVNIQASPSPSPSVSMIDTSSTQLSSSSSTFFTNIDLTITTDLYHYPWQRISKSRLRNVGPEAFPVWYRLEQYITQRQLSEHALDETFFNLLASNVKGSVAENALKNLIHRLRDTDDVNQALEREINRLKSIREEEDVDTEEYLLDGISGIDGEKPEKDGDDDDNDEDDKEDKKDEEESGKQRQKVHPAGRIISQHMSRMALPDYCVAIPKVVVTPTKMYVLEPMVETSNRVVRSFSQHADRLLRVQFLDESFFGIRGEAKTHDMIFRRLFSMLLRGIVVGGRHYEFLAFSSSQLREYGCWFIAPKSGEDGINANKVREWMGDFSEYKIIGKLAARMGQCFSSTRMTIELAPDQLTCIDDVKSSDDKYMFSDGVGRMSVAVARAVEEKMGLKELPSAIQFRLGGCKGVLTLHPPLSPASPHIEYRESQRKFNSDHRALEVIRTANYTAGALNRQIIVLLTCLGVDGNIILNRMREMMDRINRAMNDRETAIRYLQQSGDEYEVVERMVSMLRVGLLQTREIYLVNMLRVFRAYQLRELKRKANIPIEQSVMLLGVMDEFGVLEPDEIFLQYDHPGYEQPYVPTGRCAVTRNPCFHPGDIRLLKAVDKPELRHLKNVIVFSQKGYRDVPSQCSGGDLDGDEFTCIWDEKLLPESDADPMDYSAPQSPMQSNISINDIKRFFINYILHDNLGMIAHAHLAQADQLTGGAKHGICIRLAQLHSTAVDFPKTGRPAEFERGLRPRAYPHFMEKSDRGMYHSDTVLGKIYDAVTLEEFKPDNKVQLDKRMLVDGYEIFIDSARALKREYDRAIDGIMKQFGIATEWEVISGWVVRFHDAFQRRDYHLRQQVMELVHGVEKRFRHHFMREFLEAIENEEPTASTSTPPPPSNKVLRLDDLMANPPAVSPAVRRSNKKKIKWPPEIQEAIQQKASAWYYITYEPSERALAEEFSDRFSFPWLVHEHLCAIVQEQQRVIDDEELARTLAQLRH